MAEKPEEFQDATDRHNFKKMLPRDERRFKTADLDGDSAATREEFTAFLHPEEFEHMKNIVVLVSSAKPMTLFLLRLMANWGTERDKFLKFT